MDDIRQAYLTDELARLTLENSGMFAFSNSRVPSYGTAVPDPEPSMSDISDELVDFTLAELAAERGIGITELSERVLELTGGERDCLSRAQAVIELANMPDAALVELAAASKGKAKGKGWTDPDEEDETEEDDEDDLADHMAENQGNQGPKPKKPRKKKRATRPVQVAKRGQSPFGSEGGAPEGGAGPSGEGAGGAMAASAPTRRLVRAGYGYETVALSEDQEWAEQEADRLIALAASRNAPSGPSAFNVSPGTIGNISEHYDFEVHDVGARDDGDPTDRDASTEAILARLAKEHPDMFGKDTTYGANTPGKLAGKYPGTGPSGKPQNPVGWNGT